MSEQAKHSNQIFICYRRVDSAAITGRIYDRLVQKFGREAIFKDVDSMPLGVNFRKRLDAIVSECAVVLVVIGDRWEERLTDKRDFVRIEIESALRRDIPVIPLLVQGASLPPEETLPESISELSDRHGLTIGHDPHFHGDISRLISSLEAMLVGTPAPKASEEIIDSKARGPELKAPPRVVSSPLEEKEAVQPSLDAAYTSAFSRHNMSPQEAIRTERQLRWVSYGVAPFLGAVAPIMVAVPVFLAAASIFNSISYRENVLGREAFTFLVSEMSAVLTLGVIGWLCGALRPQVSWKVGLWLSAPLSLLLSVSLLIIWGNSYTPYKPENLTIFTSALFTTPMVPLLSCVGVHLGKVYAARKLRG
jgi:hypothetical protein